MFLLCGAQCPSSPSPPGPSPFATCSANDQLHCDCLSARCSKRSFHRQFLAFFERISTAEYLCVSARPCSAIPTRTKILWFCYIWKSLLMLWSVRVKTDLGTTVMPVWYDPRNVEYLLRTYDNTLIAVPSPKVRISHRKSDRLLFPITFLINFLIGFYFRKDFPSDFCPLFDQILSFFLRSDRKSYRNFGLGSRPNVNIHPRLSLHIDTSVQKGHS